MLQPIQFNNIVKSITMLDLSIQHVEIRVSSLKYAKSNFMSRLLIVITIILFTISINKIQAQQSFGRVNEIADSLYKIKKYNEATLYYLELEKRSDFLKEKSEVLYKIACCLSLTGKTDSGITILKQAIKIGYNDKKNLLSDKGLENLHLSNEWKKIINNIKDLKKTTNTEPVEVKIVTTDIYNFWKAYDKANADTANYKKIFQQYYFNKASVGMSDYMAAKVHTIDFFIKHVKSKPKFYSSIKNKTSQVDSYKADFAKAFKILKDIYPSAQFPDIYFIIGAFTSGGTVSDAGLLIGVNQYCLDDDVVTDEISANEKMISGQFNYLKFVVPHELIHFQQDGLKQDTITLGYAIQEGMADFIGELISGIKAAPDLHTWAKGKENAIWGRFKADMYYDRYDNWIANGKTSTADNPQDQGYWVGYQICKSYYENAGDKKKAINDMLNIKDYKTFLQKSNWEAKVAGLK
jgi:Predicted Zn-dependent protease (DUF2268)